MLSDPQATIIDMTPEGEFRDPPRPGFRLPASGVALIAAAGGVALLAIFLALWLAVTILPVLIGVALCSLLIARVRTWRRLHASPLARSRRRPPLRR